MKPKTIPTFNCKSEIIFKDMVSFEKNKVMLKDYAPREFAIYFSKIEGSQGRVVYEMSHPVCECGNKYHKHGVVKWSMDKEYNIYKQRYKCPKCNKTKVTPIVNLVDKGCCYTKDIKNIVINHYEKEHISYDRMSNFLNEQYNLSFSRQTIFNYNDNESDDYLKQKEELILEKIENNGIDLTGYYGHDEAFFRLNGEEKSLLAMIDSNTQRIINTNIFS